MLNIFDSKTVSLCGLQEVTTFALITEASLGAGKQRIPVFGDQNPIGFWFEILYLVVSVNDHGQGGSLYATNAEYLLVPAELQRIEAGRIHSKEPVAFGSGLASLIE